jgi:hypothetical protein
MFLDLGTRRGWGVSVTPRPFPTPGKDPIPIVQEAGSAPRPVWTGAENLAPTGIRSPVRPSSSQSLYRLSYPAHLSSCLPGIYIPCHEVVLRYNRKHHRSYHIFCLVDWISWFERISVCVSDEPRVLWYSLISLLQFIKEATRRL